MGKSPDAFRTISEVADWLGIQAHVLRFWESKFTQVKPIKRAGGRRYYRPTDMLLLGGIKKLLHDDGLTIKGVQKILREQGMSHVADLSDPLDEATLSQSQLDDTPAEVAEAQIDVAEAPEETAVVLNFEAPSPEEPAKVAAEEPSKAPERVDIAMDVPGDTLPATAPEPLEATEETPPEEPAASPPVTADKPTDPAPQDQNATGIDTGATLDTVDEPDGQAAPEDQTEAATTLPDFLRRPLEDAEPAQSAASSELDDDMAPAATDQAPNAAPPAPSMTPETAPTAPARKPRIVELPTLAAETDLDSTPSVLAAAYTLRRLDSASARQIAPLLARLTVLRDGMAARRRNAGTPPTQI